MSFLKLIKNNSNVKPLITSAMKTLNLKDFNLKSTFKAHQDKLKDYDDPAKYEYTVTNRFYPFFGWVEMREYKKIN